MKTIVITGGHHNSALVVAKEFRSRGYKVIWIGHRYAAKGDTHDSAEYIEVTSSGFIFHHLPATKFGEGTTLFDLLRAPASVLKAVSLLYSLHPAAVVSFGSYLGATVSMAAYLLRLPVFLHEQTVIAGKANKFVARFARRIYLTWPESQPHFPKEKTLVVGLPLRKSLLNRVSTSRRSAKYPAILILCGKQGSHAVNQFVFAHLQELLASFELIHQTGTSSATGDYETALSLKESLPADLSVRYQPIGYLTEDVLGKYLRMADLVAGRSGAHTTYELAVIGKRALLIPYLLTHGAEQHRHALILQKAGNAVILPQSELTLPRFEESVKEAFRLHPRSLALPTDAAGKLVDDVLARL